MELVSIPYVSERVEMMKEKDGLKRCLCLLYVKGSVELASMFCDYGEEERRRWLRVYSYFYDTLAPR